jgi:hypothetical protein
MVRAACSVAIRTVAGDRRWRLALVGCLTGPISFSWPFVLCEV